MLDDGGQSLHSSIPLNQESPQLGHALVPLLPLLLILVLFGLDQTLPLHSTWLGPRRTQPVLEASCHFRAGSRPGSRSEPENSGSRPSVVGVGGGTGGRYWENWHDWSICIHQVGYLWSSAGKRPYYRFLEKDNDGRWTSWVSFPKSISNLRSEWALPVLLHTTEKVYYRGAGADDMITASLSHCYDTWPMRDCTSQWGNSVDRSCIPNRAAQSIKM